MENSERGDDYNEVLYDVADELTAENVKSMLFLLNEDIPSSERERITTGIELISTLRSKELVGRTRLDYLKRLLSKIRRKDLEDRVKICEQKEEKISTAKHSLMWQGLVPNFIETAKCREVEQRLIAEKMAILTGISASGKSQTCIWYATKFRKEANHTTCKLMCQTDDDLLASFRSFLESSKMEFERETEAKSDYIKHMAEVAMSLIEMGQRTGRQYLFIFDDVTEATCKVVEGIIHSFHREKNVKILCSTSYAKFYKQCTENDVFVKIGGVSQSEVLEFFKDHVKMKNSEKDIQDLAEKMGHLPYGLVLANSYIFFTGMSVKKYVELLSEGNFLQNVEELIACTSQEYDKGLVSAQMLAVEQVESSSVHVKSLLRFIPFLHHNEIPLSLLRELLPESIDDRDKDTVIFDFIANVRKYCIGEIESSNQSQTISIHAVTALVLGLRLTREEKESSIRDLLCFFCKIINIDCRHKESFKNNLECLPHAAKVALAAVKITRTKEITFLMCAIHAAIGVTFRVGGIEGLLANEHLYEAKTLCFEFIDERDLHSYMFNTDERESVNCTEYIDDSKQYFCRLDSGHYQAYPSSCQITEGPEHKKVKVSHPEMELEEENVNHIQSARKKDSRVEMLYQRLVSASETLQEDVITDIIMQTKRSEHEMDHLRKVANFPGSLKHVESQQGRLSKELYEKLLEKNLAMPFKKLRTVYTVEMMIIILYNNGRNLYYQSQTEHKLSLVCWNDLRLAYLLGILLQRDYPQFLSVQSLITRRNGLLYHCLLDRKRSRVDAKDNKIVLDRIIDQYKEMLMATDSKYFAYGIVKVSEYQRIHHNAMCLKLLLKCYSTKIANTENPDDKVSYYKEGEKYAKQLEKLLEERRICHWLAVPGFHVQVARFFIEHDIEKARRHFKRAVEMEEDHNHFKLQGQFGLIKCFIRRGTPSDLEEGRTICEMLLSSLHKTNFKRQKAENYMKTITERTRSCEVTEMIG